MSTKLWIESITQSEIDENLLSGDCESLMLEGDFLYELVVEEDFLRNHLDSREIELVRPNWGEVQLRSSDTLTPEQRAQYLNAIQASLNDNSSKGLMEFEDSKGLVSDKLADRAKSPEKVLLVLEKLNRVDDPLIHRFKAELKTWVEFLEKRIERNEHILIEFID